MPQTPSEHRAAPKAVLKPTQQGRPLPSFDSSKSSSSGFLESGKPLYTPEPPTSSQPTPPARPAPIGGSWSRAYARARKPQTLLFFVLPTALLLTVYDPLGVNEKVEDAIPIADHHHRPAGVVPLEERNMTARQRASVDAALAEKARARAAAAEIEAGLLEARAAQERAGRDGTPVTDGSTREGTRRFAPWGKFFGQSDESLKPSEFTPPSPARHTPTENPAPARSGGSAMDGLR